MAHCVSKLTVSPPHSWFLAGFPDKNHKSSSTKQTFWGDPKLLACCWFWLPFKITHILRIPSIKKHRQNCGHLGLVRDLEAQRAMVQERVPRAIHPERGQLLSCESGFNSIKAKGLPIGAMWPFTKTFAGSKREFKSPQASNLPEAGSSGTWPDSDLQEVDACC